MPNFEKIQDVSFAGNEYTVYKLPYNESYVLFVVDAIDRSKIGTRNWHIGRNNYIGSTFYTENRTKKELYLHNFIMKNTIEFGGRGQHFTIDHKNRVTFDNRRANLRENAIQTEQNFNQKKRERSDNPILIANGIDPNILPKCVHYVEENGKFGDYFDINVKGLPNDDKFRPKSTKSTKHRLILKLEEAKQYLRELIDTYPEHFQERNIRFKYSDEDIELINEYNQIIELSGLDTQNRCKVVIQENTDYLAPISSELLTPEEKRFLDSCSIHNEKGKKGRGLKIPNGCGVLPSMLPKYVNYRASTVKRGDKFVIDGHPKLDKRCISSTESRSISTKDKFIMILRKLQELDNNPEYDDIINRITTSESNGQDSVFN